MKILVAIVVLGLGIVTGSAQGTVVFRNGGLTFRTTANRYVYFGAVGPGAGTPVPGQSDPNRVIGVNFVAGLYYVKGADQGDQMASAKQYGHVGYFRTAATAEEKRGTWTLPAGIVEDTFDGIGIGDTATLQVRVWDSAKFRSFEEAVAGGEFGASQPFNYTVPPMGSTPDAYYMDNLRAFAVIPEPSTNLLGILSAVILVIARRRKHS
jgi:hypothetical protein